MTLPPLRPDGALPPGQHLVTTVDDLLIAFPANTARRQALQAALVHFEEVVRRLALGSAVAMDGSYLTDKAEPEDIDLALLSTGAGETAVLQRLQAEGVDLALLDVFVETTPAGFARWATFLSFDRAGSARGTVLLTI